MRARLFKFATLLLILTIIYIQNATAEDFWSKLLFGPKQSYHFQNYKSREAAYYAALKAGNGKL